MSDHADSIDDSLPWLEAVDDEDVAAGVSAPRMLGALFLVLLAAAVVAGTFFWLGRQDAAGIGAPQLIRAEPGPYKVRPENPGGLDVGGESETAYKTSAGEDTDARLNVEALPDQPAAPAGATPKRFPIKEVKEPVESPPAPTPPAPRAGSGSLVQLGAFRNQAQAERAWIVLSARFPEVAALDKKVVPFAGGYRLRAAAPSLDEARRVCQSLRGAGENCFVAN